MPVSAGGGLTGPGSDARLLQAARRGLERAAPPQGPLALAVSGGSDSLAMLHLMAEAAGPAGRALQVVTVDHGLRPEAAEEAAVVAGICAGLGLPHRVLVWDHGGHIEGNLMQAARRARYRLMADWAVAAGIGDIALAHTTDDQAETFLMGLAREAGLDGLTGMSGSFAEGVVRFHRPFLRQTRADLRGYLARRGVTWIDDPSNDNDRFTRVRARRALGALKPLGITVDRLAAVIDHLAMAQGVVTGAVAQAGRDLVTERAGGLMFDACALWACDPEVARRLLVAMVRWIGGADHPPRAAKIAALTAGLRAGREATLGGCRFRQKAGRVSVTREMRAVQGAVPLGQLWDGRWRVTGPSGGPDGAGLEIRALGAAGLRLCPGWRATGLARPVLEATPAVWQGETLIAAPCAGAGAGFGTGWTAETVPDFGSFLLSH